MNKKIYLGIIYSVTAVCMIVGIIINVLSISSKGYTIFGHSRNTITYDEDLSSFDTLDIDMSFGNIYIKKGTSFHGGLGAPAAMYLAAESDLNKCISEYGQRKKNNCLVLYDLNIHIIK